MVLSTTWVQQLPFSLLMNEMLAVCGNPKCGITFLVENVFRGPGGMNFTMGPGNRTPCTACGHWGVINEGTYVYESETVRFMGGPAETVASLQRVKQLFEDAAKQKTTKQELIKQVTVESPSLGAFLTTVNGDTFHKWYSNVLALLTLLLAFYTTFKPSESDEANAKLVEHLNEDLRELKRKQQEQAVPATYQVDNFGLKPKRNAACDCGSGLKHKKCCGFKTTVMPTAR